MLWEKCDSGKCANGVHSQSSNLPQTWPIKIIMISMNFPHSRESIDTKIIIYFTFLLKIEFLKTKKDEIHHKKILSLPRRCNIVQIWCQSIPEDVWNLLIPWLP
jgi:hypothetical protein